MSAVAPLTAIGVDATWMSVNVRGVQRLAERGVHLWMCMLRYQCYRSLLHCGKCI